MQRFLKQEVNFEPFFFIAIFFVLLNSVKIDFLDHFSIFPYFSWPISHPSLKLLLYVIVNTLIFFFSTPDNKKYRETKEIASLLDLAQTILYASGIKFEVKTRGTNLLQFPIKNSPIVVNDCETYDREILFGKERASLVNSCN